MSLRTVGVPKDNWATNFAPTSIIAAGVMTGTTVLTSSTIDLQAVDGVSVNYYWTGSATGTVTVEVSNDGTYWKDISGEFTTTLTSPAGSAPAANVCYGFELSSYNAYARVKYTNSGSTGVLTVTCWGKKG